MRAVLITTVLVLAAVGGAAAAPATQGYQEISAPGETMDQFVVRISSHAVARTEQARVMQCGVVGQAGVQYSIHLRTDGTWQSCQIDLSDTVDGFESTGVTFRTATNDQGSKQGFTDEDFKRPRGYIAYGKVVRYQEGRTKDRPVSSR